MCGRFVCYQDLRALKAHFPIDRVEADLSPNYNVAPTQMIPAIVRQDGENVLRTFRWGLVPFWAKNQIEEDANPPATLLTVQGSVSLMELE
ncbi:MAG: SOS response-associated peptidase [Deltaproteobacteria bacterium]|jgi:putative SOS response-associated peptidase YedK|nr:SOS response-associated peptidase [Deltaproteobacteria bacterium]